MVHFNDFPTCFHPICFQTGNQFMVFQLMYNTLVERDETEAIIPGLADSWEINATATEFTFKLNPNAKWHDGTPVTADDVVHTAATAKADKDNYISTYPITSWLVTDSVEAVDPHTVKFTLAAPNSVFLENLTDPAHSIMPKHLLDGQTGDVLKASDFVTGKSPIGSGPYTFTSYTPDQFIEFDANPDYFLGAPTIGKIFFRLKVNPDTAAAQLQSGELQLALEMKPSDFEVLSTAAGIKAEQIPGVGQMTLQYMTKSPQMTDERVRQAINFAFDRKTLLETVFGGAGRLLWIDAGFNPDDPELEKYELNQDRAKELLAEAATAGPTTRPPRSGSSTPPSRWAGTRSPRRSTTT